MHAPENIMMMSSTTSYFEFGFCSAKDRREDHVEMTTDPVSAASFGTSTQRLYFPATRQAISSTR